MQRIPTLLQKISELSERKDKAGVIEIDLMLDYTRVLYADLLEWRGRAAFNDTLTPAKPVTVAPVQNVAAPAPQSMPVAEKPAQKDIRQMVGINDKYLFISELFGNDKDAYEATLNELNTFETYTQAVNWLTAKLHWEEAEETVQSFYGLLNNFFSSK